MTLREREEAKYNKVWASVGYRLISPGELVVFEFLDWAEPGKTVLDLGCGTGRAGFKISQTMPTTMVDISENCLDDSVRQRLADNLIFKQACLWELDEGHFDYGFCTDVMEHIPEEKVGRVIDSIADHCNQTYFRIYLHKDNGKFIDEPLHLTIQPKEWWIDQITRRYNDVQVNCNGTVATYFAKGVRP
jgi:SAM-dependent methyltransferase